ncbi:MAG: 1-acyl-sn-glycerol-3-phosphate acyltransferase [Spirochaetaceae bacterium]|jgi:1-acyl-sn-glycerol-3-phosphate acyltransferase|nr:1-acyl-sn-glycerol-3-phosphate acyltransferase [Spirochaetaceae bacterium]
MAYKHGNPPIGTSVFFRIASALTFYPIWCVAQFLINGIMHKTRYVNCGILRACRRAILVSNHTTFLDPVLMSGAALPHLMWQSLLEPTVETPFLGTFVRLLGGFPIPEGVSMQHLQAVCETGFRYRRFIHFYPEGECYLYNQRIQPFKDGAFYLSAVMDVPIIPMVTVFSGDFPRPKETLVVLEPVYPAGYIRRNRAGRVNMQSVREYSDAVRALMQAEIDRRGGTQALFKGRLDRITGINA